jgi:hypothetical protein
MQFRNLNFIQVKHINQPGKSFKTFKNQKRNKNQLELHDMCLVTHFGIGLHRLRYIRSIILFKESFLKY